MIPRVHYDPSRTAAQTPSHSHASLLRHRRAPKRTPRTLRRYDVPGVYPRADSDLNFTAYMVQRPRSDGTYTVPDMVLRLDKAQQGTPDACYRWEKRRNDTSRRFGWNVLKTEGCIAFLAEQRNKLKEKW
jgi:hypothetical protein